MQNNKVLQMLQERIKEQSCLYRISSLDEQKLALFELLQKAVTIIPEGWQYPEIAVAMIEFEGHRFTTPGYTETAWQLTAKEAVRQGSLLVITVAYLKPMPLEHEGPFLMEERHLIDSVINHLSLKIDRIISQQELKEKQELLDKAYRLARIGTWEYNMITKELFWSSVTKQVHGFDDSYVPDVESTISLFKEGINRETFAKAAYDAIEYNKPFDVELKIISGQGDERWIRATGEPEYVNGVCTRFYGISQNVTDRRQAEENLQLSEQRFRALVQDGSDLIAILDCDANFTYVSPTSQTILGIPAEDLIGTNAFDAIHVSDRKRVADAFYELPTAKRIQIPPYRFRNSRNEWRWIETTLTNMTEDPAVGGLVANSRDVTQQIIQQRQNQEALKEKETLLAEIHHRVKNNLAVVSGMMQLQATEEKNKVIKDRLFDSIVRIKTMANIHEQLYQSNSFSKLEFAENIRSLVMNILKTFQSNTQIDVEFSCEPIKLNINQAIPCSLIVNEVVTNIFKHAFPNRKRGKIEIKLDENTADEQISLVVKDDGVGLPASRVTGGSLGMNLIDVLAKQLDAEYSYYSLEVGTIFTIGFRREELKGIGNSFL